MIGELSTTPRLVVRPGEHREDAVVLARRHEARSPTAAGRAATRTTRRRPRAAGGRRPERGAATAAGSSPGSPAGRCGSRRARSSSVTAYGDIGPLDGGRHAAAARARGSGPAGRPAGRPRPRCRRAPPGRTSRGPSSGTSRTGAPPRRPRPTARTTVSPASSRSTLARRRPRRTRRWTCRNRTVARSAVAWPSTTTAGPAPAPARTRPARRRRAASARPTATAPGSSARSPGRGRARSPRRARRPRPRGRRSSAPVIGPPPAAAARRRRPSRPARAVPRYVARSSYVARLSRSHAWPGKCASIASRQTATGIRTGVSLCQGTGCTDERPEGAA